MTLEVADKVTTGRRDIRHDFQVPVSRRWMRCAWSLVWENNEPEEREELSGQRWDDLIWEKLQLEIQNGVKRGTQVFIEKN